jgi:hypothetical protein
VDPADIAALLTEPGVQRAEMRGRTMTGWLRVDADALSPAGQLEHWVATGTAYARSLPAKA